MHIAMTALLRLAFLLTAVTAPLAAAAQEAALKDQTVAELKAGIENEHPMTHLALATKLWEQEQKDEAVFWFYLGQIRYRYHLQANPDLPAGGDGALFGSMMVAMGDPLNQYALCDVQGFRRTVDRALAWDEAHPNGFTPKDKAPAVLASVRNGLISFRDKIVAQEASIRAQCSAKALGRADPAGR